MLNAGIMLESTEKPTKDQCWFLLHQLLPEDTVMFWWYARNAAFETETPAEYFKTKPEAVLEYISRIHGGCY